MEKEPSKQYNITTELSAVVPPDGGRGWWVVFGSFCGLFAIYGVNYSWGVFLNAYNKQIYVGEMTQLSWIGSICIGFFFIIGPINDWVTRKLGYTIMLKIATIVCPFALMMASITHEIWQLYLTQGLLMGCGASFVWFSCIPACQQWFDKKRGMAIGLAMLGSGVGGLVMSNITQAVLLSLGYRWALRILGFVCFVFLGIATLLVKPLPNRQMNLNQDMTVPMWKKQRALLCRLDFNLLLSIAFITTFGYLVPSFLLPSYASYLGLNPWVGTNLSAILSAINAVSKILLGYTSDRVGRLNTFCVCTFMAGIMCLAIWTNATTEPTIWVFATLYGLFGGGYLTMLAAIVPQIAGYHAISEANGLVYFMNLPGYLVGTPIASAIIHTTVPVHYPYAAIYAGLLMSVGGLLAFALRVLQVGWYWRIKV
ncbi:major facilitator superfamily domain-containing protein, partial [Halteromyces radiatus]|uniref:major facilitator superfamily domain-containing protein n=1 Tax=Halteromyces radiatus TaxID=101107 RepID=UPI00221E6801